MRTLANTYDDGKRPHHRSGDRAKAEVLCVLQAVQRTGFLAPTRRVVNATIPHPSLLLRLEKLVDHPPPYRCKGGVSRLAEVCPVEREAFLPRIVCVDEERVNIYVLGIRAPCALREQRIRLADAPSQR